MSQMKHAPRSDPSRSRKLSRGLAFCLGLGGADLAVLNVWVLPALLGGTATDVSASSNPPQPAAAKKKVKPALQPVADKTSAPPATLVDSQPSPAPAKLEPVVEPALPAAPAAALEPEEPRESVVLFGRGVHSVGPRGRQQLSDLAAAVNRGEQPFVIVAGHADSLGPDDYNRKLSEQRALAVADLLVEAGIERDRIKVRAYGEERPSPDGHDRRVEIQLGGEQ